MRLSFPQALLFGVFSLGPLVVHANSRGIAYPSFRYVPYETLNADTVTLSIRLGYNEGNWNIPGTNPTESSAYANLGLGKETISDLGFTEDQWDCYVNHYLDAFNDWDNLPDQVIKKHLMGIGYTEEIWDDSTVAPTSFDKFWDELTQEEQSSATELCYFQETWDRAELEDAWTEPTPPTTSRVERGVEYPSIRYLQWAFLDPADLARAFYLGYNEFTWNLPGTNPLEYIALSDQAKGIPELLAMGFTEASWDCFVNHYQYFEWDGLGTQGVQQYYTTLGFTEDTWITRDRTRPEAFDTPWEDLSVEHQAAAVQLCYFQDTWDQTDLIYWTTTPPEFAPSATPSASLAPSLDPIGAVNNQIQQDSGVPEGYGLLLSTVSILLSLFL